MRMSRWFASFFISLLTMFGCSHTVKVQSNPPGAEVFTLAASGEYEKSLGMTPFSFDANEAVVIAIEKSGYWPTRVVLPRAGISSSSEITVKLDAQKNDDSFMKVMQKKPDAISNYIDKILEFQALIATKNTQKVNDWLKENAKQYENLAVFHALVGNFYFLEGQMNEAQKRYKRAIELEPDHQEAKAMMKIIEQKAGNKP